MKTWKWMTAVALTVSMWLGAGPALAAKTSQTLSSESVIEKIKKRGALKVGLSTFVPWAMRDKRGNLIGYEIDVATQLAKDMDVEVEFYPTAWDGIIPALLAGKFDVIISGMSITTKRNLSVNFTKPYAYSGLKMVANKKMTEGMSSFDDFNNSNVTFTARRGATPAVAIQNIFPKAKLLQFDEDGAAIQEVLNGKAHATVAAEPSPSWDVARNPETLHIPIDQLFDQKGEAMALRKGDPDATNLLNNWIEDKWRSGWLKARHDYWFTTREWEDQVATK